MEILTLNIIDNMKIHLYPKLIFILLFMYGCRYSNVEILTGEDGTIWVLKDYHNIDEGELFFYFGKNNEFSIYESTVKGLEEINNTCYDDIPKRWSIADDTLLSIGDWWIYKVENSKRDRVLLRRIWKGKVTEHVDTLLLYSHPNTNE